ncbi:type II toxin-antitoxin system VapC family toxin [Sediminibacterium goheungense]|uniref:Putative nucleic acid-binding protein n=1 Tax=Sediminibacterium goheungense TaxID=1086393 RepID=A0A4R6IXM9_9BACT|nr:PIN domain-containing protein [Sediminibacterium goheungense]TDO27177.1 putative nucleic acid-binding protein [Sediminibacterium goheungense]
MKVFLDINIVLDFLLKRPSFDDEAMDIFKLLYKKEIDGYLSAVSYTQIGYYLQKYVGKPAAKEILRDLNKLFTTVTVDNRVLEEALDSAIKDFDDAVQYASALSVSNLYCIITRDKKDFKSSQIIIQSPKEFINAFNH